MRRERKGRTAHERGRDIPAPADGPGRGDPGDRLPVVAAGDGPGAARVPPGGRPHAEPAASLDRGRQLLGFGRVFRKLRTQVGHSLPRPARDRGLPAIRRRLAPGLGRARLCSSRHPPRFPLDRAGRRARFGGGPAASEVRGNRAGDREAGAGRVSRRNRPGSPERSRAFDRGNALRGLFVALRPERFLELSIGPDGRPPGRRRPGPARLFGGARSGRPPSDRLGGRGARRRSLALGTDRLRSRGRIPRRAWRRRRPSRSSRLPGLRALQTAPARPNAIRFR